MAVMGMGLDITPHPLPADEEELRPNLWEDVPKPALTSPARVMNPDKGKGCNPTSEDRNKAKQNKGHGITSIMCFLDRVLKADLHKVSHPLKDSIYFW